MISMNRNTSPIKPFSQADYINAFQLTEDNQYPEYENQRFKEIYGEINGFQPNEIELANGSDEWIQKLMITFGKGGVLTLNPDFFMYQAYANQFNMNIQFVNAEQNFAFDLDTIVTKIKQSKPELFILSNPHNPTGKQFSEVFLQTIADTMADVNGYLAIDEAYIEFGKDYRRPTGQHVIILRTMSKMYGMAGLRIGIMHAKGDTFVKLTRINHPYPVNNLVLNLASNFLENEEKLELFINYQLKSRDLLVQSFDLVADIIEFKSTAANFVFTYGVLAKDLGIFLQKNDFNSRFYTQKLLNNVVRYSIIEIQDYPKLTEAIKEWRNQRDYERT